MVAKTGGVGKRNSRHRRALAAGCLTNGARRGPAVADDRGFGGRLAHCAGLGRWEGARRTAYRAETPRRARDCTRRTSSSLSYGFKRKSHSTLMS
jgi:hypothetical protein